MNRSLNPMPKNLPPADQLPVAVEMVERRIYLIRDQKVMLDSDLAELYQIATGNLNLAVRRNSKRFPEDFLFQLTKEEADALLLQTARAKTGRGGRQTPPYAFTELGVAMLSSVLNSERAVQMNIIIMRAFVRMRELLASNRDLARKIEQMEATQKQHSRTQQEHTSILIGVVQDIQKLKHPPQTRAIGFVVRSPKKR